MINGKQTAKGLQDERADVRRHLEPSEKGVRGTIASPTPTRPTPSLAGIKVLEIRYDAQSAFIHD